MPITNGKLSNWDDAYEEYGCYLIIIREITNHHGGSNVCNGIDVAP